MRILPTVFLLGFFAIAAGPAFGQNGSYKNKVMTVVLGGPPGGSADMRTRAVIAILRRHIPGNPLITLQYMPGGGGRQAANHIYQSARPDGLTLGSMGAALVANAMLGATGVQYDIQKFHYLGTPDSAQHYVFFTRSDLGLDSLAKLRARSELRIGAQSVGHPVYITGRLFAFILGLKDSKFVTGYTGPEIDLALFNREIDARVGTGETILRRSPEWLEKKLIEVHAGIEIPKGERGPQFAQLPDLETFAASPREKRIVEMFRAFRIAGQSFFLPPGTPAAEVRTLQEAMRRTFKDAAFAKEYVKLSGEMPTPLMPEALEKVIGGLERDTAVVALFKQLAGPGPLPPR